MVLDGVEMEDVIENETGFDDFGRYAYDYHDWDTTVEIIKDAMRDEEADEESYDFGSRTGLYMDDETKRHASEFVEFEYGYDEFGRHVLEWLDCDGACEVMYDFLNGMNYDMERFELGEF
jgi:hypothetical protein